MTANDLRIGDVVQTPTSIIIITQVGNTYIWARDNNNRNVVLLKNEIKEFFDKGTWKLIPAAPDILAQLREALGWQTGTLEDVLTVLRACKGFYDLTEVKTDKEYARREHAVMVNLNHAIRKIK